MSLPAPQKVFHASLSAEGKAVSGWGRGINSIIVHSAIHLIFNLSLRAFRWPVGFFFFFLIGHPAPGTNCPTLNRTIQPQPLPALMRVASLPSFWAIYAPASAWREWYLSRYSKPAGQPPRARRHWRESVAKLLPSRLPLQKEYSNSSEKIRWWIECYVLPGLDEVIELWYLGGELWVQNLLGKYKMMMKTTTLLNGGRGLATSSKCPLIHTVFRHTKGWKYHPSRVVL